LSANDIKHIRTNSQAANKTSTAERVIKSLRRLSAKILLEKITENKVEIALDMAVETYNNTYHAAIKMLPIEARR
jgi:hypothetical protein